MPDDPWGPVEKPLLLQQPPRRRRTDAMEPETGIRIAPTDLSPEALRGVVEEFATRDGTNLAEGEVKVAQVMNLVERGEVEIWFNAVTRTCNIVAKPRP